MMEQRMQAGPSAHPMRLGESAEKREIVYSIDTAQTERHKHASEMLVAATRVVAEAKARKKEEAVPGSPSACRNDTPVASEVNGPRPFVRLVRPRKSIVYIGCAHFPISPGLHTHTHQHPYYHGSSILRRRKLQNERL